MSSTIPASRLIIAALLRSGVQIEREADDRWIAEIPAIPGCMVYGETADAARAACVDLAWCVFYASEQVSPDA